MLTFECKDLGIDCSFVAKGDTVEEVKMKAIEHAQTIHKEFLAKLSLQQKEDLDKTLSRLTH